MNPVSKITGSSSSLPNETPNISYKIMEFFLSVSKVLHDSHAQMRDSCTHFKRQSEGFLETKPFYQRAIASLHMAGIGEVFTPDNSKVAVRSVVGSLQTLSNGALDTAQTGGHLAKSAFDEMLQKAQKIESTLQNLTDWTKTLLQMAK